MDNKKKIIFLKIWIFLGIAIIFGSIIAIYIFPNILSSINEASAVAIIGGVDGPTTIYITAKYNWKLTLIILLLLLILDFIFLAIVNIIEHKKPKKIKLIYKSIIIFLVNLLFSILLFPGVFVWSLLIAAIIIILIIIKNKLIKKK
jgi:Na+-transporting methylmalonyl-CoA/oxaloacetate decarboxylase beta subunit